MIETPTRKAVGGASVDNPAGRLSTALKMARATVIVCSDDRSCHEEEDVGNDELLQVDDISQSVASTRDLTLAMEMAGLEMQQALREAQEFLTSEVREEPSTKDQRQDISTEIRQDIECTERDSTEANDMQTPDKVDVQSLLDEIAALKQCVKEANDEVSELKSAINNPAKKHGLNASPVDEVLLCSKSTCDTTLITCSSQNNDEYNYNYGYERGEMNADDICANGRDCFGSIFAKMFMAIFTNEKRMLTEAYNCR